jgi:hypothetical protein
MGWIAWPHSPAKAGRRLQPPRHRRTGHRYRCAQPRESLWDDRTSLLAGRPVRLRLSAGFRTAPRRVPRRSGTGRTNHDRCSATYGPVPAARHECRPERNCSRVPGLTTATRSPARVIPAGRARFRAPKASRLRHRPVTRRCTNEHPIVTGIPPALLPPHLFA